MKKILFIVLIVISTMVVYAQEKTLYDFKVKDIDNKEFDLSSLKGKKVLIVNVASLCGLTPQYAELERLYTTYKDRNFIVIGFPSNDFKGQEPGTNEEIKTFCSSTYGVTFPMMSKIEVIGDSIAPIYKWLTKKTENGKFDADVQWNFQKFMIDENGNLVDFAAPKTSPWDSKIVTWIEY
ncbi:MAG: glutathione peroxidase [Dysgonomonas sp.]